MAILEDVVCRAVELYCIKKRDGSVMSSTLADINRVDKIIETPAIQFNSTSNCSLQNGYKVESAPHNINKN